MSLHKEISFETEICQHLAEHGWLYAENDAGYDRARALFPAGLDWDWCAAESALRKALDLDPSYSQAQRLLGIALSHMGRNEEGQEAARRARELDPFDATHHVLSAQVAFNARDS